MKTLMKVLTLLFAVQAFALPQGPCGNESCCGQRRAKCCEPTTGPMAFSFCRDIGLACPSDFYAYGEFLYMQAAEGGLEYAISFTPCETPTGNDLQFPVTNGNIEDFSKDNRGWHWNEGWRVGFGFLTRDCWNLEAYWTHVNITNHSTTSLNSSQLLVPLWMVSNPDVDQTTNQLGSARWKGDFNTFDFQFSRPSHVSRYFTMNPHLGVRFAFIDQYYQADYSGIWNNQEGANFSANNDFWGIGTRAGIDTEWLAGCGAGLYGNFSASILYGKFDVSQSWLGASIGGAPGPLNEENAVLMLSPSDLMSDIEYEIYTSVANIDMQLGVFWSLYFCDMRYRVLAKLGYEFQFWWDQNRMRKWSDSVSPLYNDTVSRGDLSLNGLVFRLQFDF